MTNKEKLAALQTKVEEAKRDLTWAKDENAKVEPNEKLKTQIDSLKIYLDKVSREHAELLNDITENENPNDDYVELNENEGIFIEIHPNVVMSQVKQLKDENKKP